MIESSRQRPGQDGWAASNWLVKGDSFCPQLLLLHTSFLPYRPTLPTPFPTSFVSFPLPLQIVQRRVSCTSRIKRRGNSWKKMKMKKRSRKEMRLVLGMDVLLTGNIKLWGYVRRCKMRLLPVGYPAGGVVSAVCPPGRRELSSPVGAAMSLARRKE